ncbi:unnamed protein product, partial [Pylaiella littoralis]
PARGHTVVCNKSGTCVKGNYKPSGAKTAHRRLASAANMKNPIIGASIKPGGAVGLRSETVNRNNHGKCDMAGTKLGEKTKRQIEAGKVLSVNAYKTRNDKKRP